MSPIRTIALATCDNAVVHTAITKGLAEKMEPKDFDFYWEGIAKGWAPPVIFPTNLPEFIPSLMRQGDAIGAYLYDAPDEMPTLPRSK